MEEKNILTFKNFIILVLIIIIGVMFFTNKKGDDKVVEKFQPKLTPAEDYTYCQRIFYYDNSDVYSIASCDGEVHIRKNDKDEKQVDIQNVLYIYNFYTVNDNLVYFLTEDGSVYHLSRENLRSTEYKIEKLDLDNIYTIQSFHLGKARDDAYTNKIYAVDVDGKMHLIKSGN